MEHVVASNFRRDWIRENIRVYAQAREEQDHPEIEAAACLVAEATSKGISRSALEWDVGDLEEFLSECIENARERAASPSAKPRR